VGAGARLPESDRRLRVRRRVVPAASPPAAQGQSILSGDLPVLCHLAADADVAPSLTGVPLVDEPDQRRFLFVSCLRNPEVELVVDGPRKDDGPVQLFTPPCRSQTTLTVAPECIISRRRFVLSANPCVAWSHT
jgi:hypothetical protein